MIARGLDPYALARESGIGYTTLRRLLDSRADFVHVQLGTAERLCMALNDIPVRITNPGVIGPDPGPPVVDSIPERFDGATRGRRTNQLPRVTRDELLALTAIARRCTPEGSPFPGKEMMHRHLVSVADRVVKGGLRAITVEDVDAILTAAEQTANYRAERGWLPDPYAADRALTVDIYTRLRAQMVDAGDPDSAP